MSWKRITAGPGPWGWTRAFRHGSDPRMGPQLGMVFLRRTWWEGTLGMPIEGHISSS